MFEWIGNMIINAIGAIFWYISVAPFLQILNAFETVFNVITKNFINAILFEGGKVDINSIPQLFWYFVGAGFFIAIVFFFWNMFQGYTEGGNGLKEKVVNSLKYGGKSVFWIMLIPFIIVAMAILYDLMIQLLDYMFDTKNMNENMTLTDRIYQMACTVTKESSSYTDFYDEVSGLWKGATINPKYQGDEKCGIAALCKYPDNWIYGSDWNILISILGPVASCYLFYKLSIGMLENYIWIAVLSIVAPVAVFISVRDKGEKLQSWISDTRRRLSGTVGNYLAFLFFIFFMNIISSKKFVDALGLEGIVKSLIQILSIIAIIKVSILMSDWFAELWDIRPMNDYANGLSNSSINTSKNANIKEDLARLKNSFIARKTGRAAKSSLSTVGRGIGATGILGKGVKQVSKDSLSKSLNNSNVGKGLNALRQGKAKALSNKSKKLKLKANKISNKDFKNEKQFNRILNKTAKLNKKSEQVNKKSKNLKTKVERHKQILNNSKKEK